MTDDKAKETIKTATTTGQFSALGKMAMFPAFMLACYIALILYFKGKGGYKPVEISGGAAQRSTESKFQKQKGGSAMNRPFFFVRTNHSTTSVPTPLSVKISSMTEWECAHPRAKLFSTPDLIAATALSTLGIIPLSTMPAAAKPGLQVVCRWVISVAGIFGVARISRARRS